MLTTTIGALALAAAVSAEPTTVGPWTVDATGDKKIVSQAASTSWPGGAPRLVLRCHTWSEPGKLFGKHKDRDVYLYSVSAFEAEEGDLMVTFEGDAQPRKFWGAPSEDRHSFFIRGMVLSGGTDGFIRALTSHAKVTLVVVPKKKPALPEISFDLAQLEEAMRPLLEACPMKKK